MKLQDIDFVLRNTAAVSACQLKARVMDAVDDGSIDSEVKEADGSRVTAIDLAVERAMGATLGRRLSGFGDSLAIAGEEGTVIGNYDGATFVVFFDPTDGTALVRLLAPGSTTGCSLYDKDQQRFLAGAVADPWLERVVFTDNGVTYQQRFNLSDGTLLGEPTRCTVSEKSFADGGELLIEVAHEFTRKVYNQDDKRPVLSQSEITRFWGDAHTKLGIKVRSLSSNLMHQMLVASGGDAIATVMTAIGGPWDMSGIPLVQNAGGYVVYVRDRDGLFYQTDNPMLADLVICANSFDTASQVFDVLVALRSI